MIYLHRGWVATVMRYLQHQAYSFPPAPTGDLRSGRVKGTPPSFRDLASTTSAYSSYVLDRERCGRRGPLVPGEGCELGRWAYSLRRPTIRRACPKICRDVTFAPSVRFTGKRAGKEPRARRLAAFTIVERRGATS